MRRRPRREETEPMNTDVVNVTVLLARLDSIVDRLDGVYERLMPEIQARTGRVPGIGPERRREG